MTESTQMFMMFCITVIVTVGIISAIICFSKDPFNLDIKTRKKSPLKTTSQLNIKVRKKNR